MSGRFIRGALLAMGTALCSGAYASGFAINDKSVSGLGAGFAGEATVAEDASTVYNNPAGMLALSGRQFTAGLNRISSQAKFTNNGSNVAVTGTGAARNNADKVAYAPNFYYVDELSSDVRFGFGINSPFGLGLNYDKDWIGRYHTISTDIRTVSLNPAVAFRMNSSLTVGGGLDIQYMDAAMTQAVDFGAVCVAKQAAVEIQAGATQAVAQATALAKCNAVGLQPQQDDGLQKLKGTSWAPGYSLGATLALSDTTQVGAVFHSGVNHKLKGTSTFETVPTAFATTFTDSDATVKVNLPASASLGVAQAMSDRLRLLAEYTWTGWSAYKELRVDFSNALPDSVSAENWRDTNRYSLGALYQYDNHWLIRGGFFYDETPVRSATYRTPRLPDTDRRWVTMGAKWAPQADFSVDMALAYMTAKQIPISRTDSSNHTIKGTYELTGTYLSVQSSWRF